MHHNRILFSLIILPVLLCLLRCSGNEPERLLAEAETALSSSLEETKLILDRIERPGLLDEKGKADYNRIKAICLLELGLDHEMADSLGNEALKYYLQRGDTTRVIQTLHLTAHSALSNGNRGDAILKYQELLRIAESGKTGLRPSRYHSAISRIFANEEQYEQAIFHAGQALDSATNNLQRVALYRERAHIFHRMNRIELALNDYRSALDGALKGGENNREASAICNQIADLYRETGNFREAIRYSEQGLGLRASRKDIAPFNLTKARIFLAENKSDSARIYLEKTINSSEDHFITLIAYRQLSELYSENGDEEPAFYRYQNYRNLFDDHVSSLKTEVVNQKYREAVLENENNQLKLAKQEREIYLLSLLFVLILLIVSLLFFLFRIRKKREMREQEQQNLLLKKENELMQLRERAGALRESLLRKMSLSEKIPSLDSNGTGFNEENRRIRLNEKDWEELIDTVDQLYTGFVSRLRTDYPGLANPDLAFCCLIKIRVSMQDMADIYCISKAGITKRKTRMKKEKFRIADESVSLDDFLLRY